MKSNEIEKKTMAARAGSSDKSEKTKPTSLPENGGERLQKLLSRAGVASRRAAEKLIAEGQVSVNGHVIKELGAKADPLNDKIVVAGKPLHFSDGEKTVVLLHKPRGFMTTKSDPEGRPIVMDLLPKKLQTMNPVGRLDFDTSGVLLLTDDGDLLHLLTHPSHGVEKIYHARVGGQFQMETVKKLEAGVVILEGDETRKKPVKTAPCRVRVRAQTESNALVEISLREGRNRQVRKMIEAVGHPVSSLRRIKFAGLELEDLPAGSYRILLPGEVHAVRKSVARVVKNKLSREEAISKTIGKAAQAAAAAKAATPKPRRAPQKDSKFSRPASRDKTDERAKSSQDKRDFGQADFWNKDAPDDFAPRGMQKPVPSRSTYGTKNKAESNAKPRAASDRSSSNRPANSTSRSTNSSPRSASSSTRSTSSRAPERSARPKVSSAKNSSTPKSKPALGERIRRQWKND